LVEQGGVEVNGEKVTDSSVLLANLIKDNEAVIQVGKRRFVKISNK
jgi:tyrosyl-tRNA synthetase